MGNIGLGHGSEWHLLSYLGRHRCELNKEVQRVTGAQGIEWLDFPTRRSERGLLDREWKGLDFVPDATTRAAWHTFWPQHAGIQNWDAVGHVKLNGRSEWLLVEAKAHCAEIESSCGAKPEGGLEQIQGALDSTKAALGVERSRDWMNPYYQFCNRLAVLQFLESRGNPAHLLFVYFTGDSADGRDCPKDASDWQAAIAAQNAHVGLPVGHALQERIHKIFLPVFTNLHGRHLGNL